VARIAVLSDVFRDNVAVPTTVEVYRVESDNTTGAFLGFGSLLEPALVFIHPASSPREPDGPVEPPIDPGPDRPGPYRPDLPTRPVIAQRSHDELGHPGVGQPDLADVGRARCRIRSGLSVLTLDGELLAAPTVVSAPRSVQLDVSFAGEIGSVTVPQGPGQPTAEEAAAAVLAYVAEAARNDPPAPSDPPPVGPDVLSDSHPHPGRRPWYCVICPGAFGC
jgi:hypothetical protein